MSSYADMSRRQFMGHTLAVGAGTLALGGLAAQGAPEQGKQWQIGCYTRPWADQDYRVALDAIVEAGFRHVGLMTAKGPGNLVLSAATTPEQAVTIAEEVKKRKLTVLSVYGGGIAVNKSLQAGIDDLRRLIDNCAACGTRSLLMGGTGDPKLYDAYYKAIAECCDYAAAKGMEIVVKPHGGLNATGPQCRQTVELVGHKNFRIWYDPGNIFYYSDGTLDPVCDAPSVDGLVTGVCVKDYRHPKDVAVTPGTGRVDFPRVLERLRDGGFGPGPLVIECVAAGDAKQSIAQARNAREFLEQLVGPASSIVPVATADAAVLHAGVASADITPPVGYRMSGYFHERLATGTLNPLKARAMVLTQGQTRTAIVSCDIIGLSPTASAQARKIASAETGIPAENLLLAATHTHTGPLYWGALRNHFHRLAVEKSGSDPCEQVDYPRQLAEGIAKAIAQATTTARPARLEAGKTRQEGLSFNRRFHMKNSEVRFNPGVLNPDIVRPAGPIDPDVGIVSVRDAHGRRLAALVNFALHLDTTGGTLYAADYPYFLEQSLQSDYGEDFMALFGTGTCGDINHIDVTNRDRLKPDVIGGTLAGTVKSAAGQLADLAVPMLAAKSRVVQVAVQKFTAGEIAWAGQAIHKVGSPDLPFLEQVRAYKILAVQALGESMPIEVQVVRLSTDTAIVGLPGEVFVDIGLAIKQASPFANMLVIELCQDAPGYIPTQKAFAEGSYETVNSRIAPGGGEIMQKTAIDLLKELQV